MSESKKNNIRDGAIGVFDSGLGGLSVLKHFLADLPRHDYLYLGDTARLPYGEKSPDTIYEYSRQGADFLFRRGCRLVVIACNTASSLALRRLQQEYLPAHYPDRRLLGVIRPLAESLATLPPGKTIGVIGTKATIASGAYEAEIKKLGLDHKIVAQATPLLVPLIENGWADKPETKMILKKYLHSFKVKQVQALILACTHYPLLYRDFRRLLGKRVYLPDPGEIVSRSLAAYLQRHPELGLAAHADQRRLFFTTDDPSIFQKAAEKFLSQSIPAPERVDLNVL